MSPHASHHRNNFHLLRLIFSLLVLLSHAPELVDGDRSRELLTRTFHTLSFGEFAVDGFFLLSGYLIVQSWTQTPRLWAFLQKRMLRIYPGFIVAFLISVVLVGPLGGADPVQYFANLSVVGVIKQMMQLRAPEVPPVFQGQPYPMVNGAMWTISYEFKMYLAVLVLGAAGALYRRAIWFSLFAAIFALFILQSTVPHIWPNVLIGPLAARVDYFRLASFFFAGGCYYLYREDIPFKGRTAIVLATLLVLSLFDPRSAEVALVPLGGYLLFYVGLKHIPTISEFGKMPDVSYGVYLYGWPVQKILFWYFPSISPWTLFGCSSIASILLGLISWHVVEKPFLRLKRLKPETRSEAPSIIVASGPP